MNWFYPVKRLISCDDFLKNNDNSIFSTCEKSFVIQISEKIDICVVAS